MPTIWDALLGNIPRQPGAPGYAYPPTQVPDLFDMIRTGIAGAQMKMPPPLGVESAMGGAVPPPEMQATGSTDIMGLLGKLFSGGTTTPGVTDFVPNFNTMAKGLGAMAALPGGGQSVPAVPQMPVGNLAATAAREVLPERSPLYPGPAAPMVPEAPAAKIGSQFSWPAQPAAAGGTQNISIPGASGAQPAGDFRTQTASLLRSFEGFRETPYWDVNAHRVGYGTDTITEPTGTIRSVKPGDKITREDAERDLSRRIGEFSGTASRQIGEEAWNKLPENVKAGLTSVTYNYGSLPDKVAAAAKTGDPAQIASAVAGLKGDNGGVNADRRTKEAAVISGTSNANAFGMPGAPQTTSPQLPIPPQLAAMQGINPAVFDAFLKARAMMAPPMNTSDRITNVLGQGAGATVGARNVGDLLARFGGGVGKAASENINRDRGELQQGANLSQDLLRQFAEVGVKKEAAGVEGRNLQTEAANKNAMLLNQVKTEQAKLDTANQNRIKEVESQIDWKKWELGQPQVTVSKDGDSIHTIARKPDGGIDISTMKLGDGLKKIDEQIKTIRDVTGDKRSPMTDALEIQAINAQARGNPEVAKALAVTKIARDSIREGTIASILPEDTYKALVKEAEKGLDPKLLGSDAKGYNQQKEDRMFALLEKQRLANPVKFEQLFIPKAAELGNAVAIHLGGRR